MNSRKKILYFYPVLVSFVKNDIELLSREFKVESFAFTPRQKIFTPLYFFLEFFFLFFKIKGSSILVSQFGGYHSYLPSLFGKIFRIPVVVVLGGTDCVSFPSIHYGNFNKKILGWFTYKSLKMATHLCPVHESLVISDYSYTDSDSPKQGYKYFCPDINAPHTSLCYGYNPEKFFKSEVKVKNSFLTVAQMNKPNFYRKGVDLIFACAQKFPDYKFTVVGNTKKMQYEFVPSNVILMPFVPYDELRKIYSQNEFYFQLSICEGFPSAPCEAMLCECIPIVSNVAALPEIAGDTGFILKEKNISALEKLVKEALQCDRKSSGEKARQRVIDKYPPSEREKFLELIRVNAK